MHSLRSTHQTPRATVIIRAVSAPPPTSVPLLTTASTLLTGSVIPPPFGNRFVAEVLEGTVDRSSLRLVHRGLVGDAYYQVYMADNVLRVGERDNGYDGRIARRLLPTEVFEAFRDMRFESAA